MGQYHHPVCIEMAEGLSPNAMDAGLKEGEQGFSRPSTPNVIVALVCARGGNMPADCAQSPLIGRWAGTRVLIQGDYAEDTDIPGWKGPRLSKLYRAMTPAEERKPKRAWNGVPVFQDITQDACAFLEAACNIRYFEQEQVIKDNTGKILDRWTSDSFDPSQACGPALRRLRRRRVRDRGRLYRTRPRISQAMRHAPGRRAAAAPFGRLARFSSERDRRRPESRDRQPRHVRIPRPRRGSAKRRPWPAWSPWRRKTAHCRS